MGIVTVLAIASLVVAAGSAYMQHQDQVAARNEQKKAAATSAAENAAQQQQNVRDQVRQQRVRTAQIIQASANTGTLGSSGEIGGTSALASQVDSNVASINRNANSQGAVLADQNAANGYMGQAATWGSVGQIAGSAFNLTSNTPQFKQTTQQWFGQTT